MISYYLKGITILMFTRSENFPFWIITFPDWGDISINVKGPVYYFSQWFAWRLRTIILYSLCYWWKLLCLFYLWLIFWIMHYFCCLLILQLEKCRILNIISHPKTNCSGLYTSVQYGMYCVSYTKYQILISSSIILNLPTLLILWYVPYMIIFYKISLLYIELGDLKQ